MDKEKVVVSFSGGKDSTLALYRMIKSEYKIIGLIVTFDNPDSSCFHRIPKEILKEVSKNLEIPLFEVNCYEGKIYEEEFEKALIMAKNKGAEICVFGDIDIEKHKKWGVGRCLNAGIRAEFPLWQENRESITNEFLDYGFKALIKKVNLKYLGEEFLGKELTKELIEKIKSLGSDPCGENGEYHTIVIDGPIFKKRVQLKIIDKDIIEDFGYLTISN